MAHNSLVWPVAPTDGVSTLDSAKLVQLDQGQFKSINGDDGGTWAPSASVQVGGAGLGAYLPAKTDALPWPTFGADAGAIRTFKKAFLPTPANRLISGTLTSGAWIQGNNGASGCFSRKLDVPDGATITNVRMFVNIVTGHVSLPTLAPGLTVQRLKPGASATLTDVLDSADTTKDGKTITYTLPGAVGTYNALGEVFVDYPCNQNNVTDRNQYEFLLTVQDETGGGAITGNIFSGGIVTFTLPKLAVDGALQ